MSLDINVCASICTHILVGSRSWNVAPSTFWSITHEKLLEILLKHNSIIFSLRNKTLWVIMLKIIK